MVVWDFFHQTVFELDSSFAPSIWHHLAQLVFHPILIVTRPSAVPLWCGGKFRKAGEKKPPSPWRLQVHGVLRKLWVQHAQWLENLPELLIRWMHESNKSIVRLSQRGNLLFGNLSVFLVGVNLVGIIPPDEPVLSGASWVVERPRSVLRGRHSAQDFGELFEFFFQTMFFFPLLKSTKKSTANWHFVFDLGGKMFFWLPT